MAQARDTMAQVFDSLEDLDLGPFNINQPVPHYGVRGIELKKRPRDEESAADESPSKRARFGFFAERKEPEKPKLDIPDLDLIKKILDETSETSQNILTVIPEYFNERKIEMPENLKHALELKTTRLNYNQVKCRTEFLFYLLEGKISVIDEANRLIHRNCAGCPTPYDNLISKQLGRKIHMNELKSLPRALARCELAIELIQRTLEKYEPKSRVAARACQP